jgi:hypothetical protein
MLICLQTLYVRGTVVIYFLVVFIGYSGTTYHDRLYRDTINVDSHLTHKAANNSPDF